MRKLHELTFDSLVLLAVRSTICIVLEMMPVCGVSRHVACECDANLYIICFQKANNTTAIGVLERKRQPIQIVVVVAW